MRFSSAISRQKMGRCRFGSFPIERQCRPRCDGSTRDLPSSFYVICCFIRCCGACGSTLGEEIPVCKRAMIRTRPRTVVVRIQSMLDAHASQPGFPGAMRALSVAVTPQSTLALQDSISRADRSQFCTSCVASAASYLPTLRIAPLTYPPTHVHTYFRTYISTWQTIERDFCDRFLPTSFLFFSFLLLLLLLLPA